MTVQISNMTDTWNAGGTTFTAIKMAVTDTASAAASVLLDLSSSGNTSQFKYGKNGQLLMGDTPLGNSSSNAYGIDIGADGNGANIFIRLGDTKTSSTGGIPYLQLDGCRSDGNTHFYGRVLCGTRRTDGTSITTDGNCGAICFGGQYGSGATYTDANWLMAACIKGQAEGTWSAASTMPTGITFWTGQVGTVGKNSNNDFGTLRGRIDYQGNWRFTAGALATSATNGFVYIPTCAGTPSGVPTSVTGGVPMVYDTTNNKFYIYNGGWKGGTTPGTFA